MKTHAGLWWTPSVPGEKVIGTLTIQSDGSPSLDVEWEVGHSSSASLTSIVTSFSRNENIGKSVIVHGQSHTGELFTLYNGFVTSTSLTGTASSRKATLFFNNGFKGANVDHPESLRISKINMRYFGMDAWLGASPFHIEHENEWKTVSITHTIPNKELFQIDDQRQLALCWSRNGPTKSIVQTRIQLNVLPWLGIEYQSPVTLDNATDDAANVGQMLSIFLGSPTTIQDLTFKSPDYTFKIGDRTHNTELRALTGRFKLPQSFRKWIKHDVLIPLSDVRDQFESLVQRWFRLRHESWGAIVPYIVSQRSPSPIAERRFFDLAASAESIHSHFRPNESSFSAKEAKEILKNISPSIPKERLSAYRSSLHRVNELTYKDRLERLLNRFPSLAQDVIGNQEKQAKFCKLVKDLRNVEAHRLRRTDETNVGGSTLIRLAAKIKVILDAWILAELGLSDSDIEKAMRKNREYWFYASHETWNWNFALED